MKFGLMYSFVVPPDTGCTNLDAYREMDDLLPLAEELGFEGFHTTEHHFQFNGWAPSPLVVLGKAAGLTKRMRLVTNILIVPLYHPLRLAEDVATLDNLSEGRVTLGVSPGYVSEELAAFGVSAKERFGRFEEALDLMELAWKGEPFTWEGRHFNLPEAKVVPKPVQDRIPIWYGVSGPKLLRRAAERGVPVTASPRHTVDELISHFRHYGEVATANGYTPTERPVIREVFIAPTTEAAERLAGPAVTHMFSLYSKKSAQGERELRNDSGELITHEGMMDFRTFSSRYVIGDPPTAVREIKKLRKQVQLTELICRMQLPGIPTRDLERSIRLFAEEVMPAFSARLPVPGPVTDARRTTCPRSGSRRDDGSAADRPTPRVTRGSGVEVVVRSARRRARATALGRCVRPSSERGSRRAPTQHVTETDPSWPGSAPDVTRNGPEPGHRLRGKPVRGGRAHGRTGRLAAYQAPPGIQVRTIDAVRPACPAEPHCVTPGRGPCRCASTARRVRRTTLLARITARDEQ